MTKPQKNPFEDAVHLVLPLGTWMDEFEDFFIATEHIYHGTDYVDNPGEHGTDTFYYYNIDGDNIWVQCIFYQEYSREEKEKERTETAYISMDKVFTKGIKGGDGDEAEKYEDGKLTKDQKKRHDELVRLNTPHLIEQDKEGRTPEAIAKIKAFLFYQSLGKEKARKLIQNEIEKLGDKAKKEDIDELNEIIETGTIKRPKHYEQLYCMMGLREIAKADKSPEGKKHLEEVENYIKQLKEDM